MYSKSAVILSLLLILLGNHTFAQKDDNETQPVTFNIIPPSPNAASLSKYADIPVSHYTGIPSIDVPIYTVVIGNLNLPISLSYHASGIKADEVASNVGLGWSLNSGGAVVRTVQGLPDEGTYGFLTNGVDLSQVSASDAAGLKSYYTQVSKNLIDLQPDIYEFNFFGKSAKFILDRSTRTGFAYNNDEKLDISWQSDGLWVITDNAGTKYYFGTYGGNSAFDRNIVSDNGRVNPITFSGVTSWYLVYVQDILGNSINLNYIPYVTTYCQENQETIYNQYAGDQFTNYPTDEVKAWNQLEVRGVKISAINWKGGTVSFNYSSSSRTDLNSTDNALQSIVVQNKQSAPLTVARYNFSYTYFGIAATQYTEPLCTDGTTGRLKLDQIQQQSSDGVLIPPYVFHYYQPQLPLRNSKAQDHWGYYNGAQNTTLIPRYTFKIPGTNTVLELPGGDRSPKIEFAANGTLNELDYPTGGNVKFFYALNDAYMKDFDFESEPSVPLVIYAQASKSQMHALPVVNQPFTVNGITPGPDGVRLGQWVYITTSVNGSCDPSSRAGGCSGTAYVMPANNGSGSSWVFASQNAVHNAKQDHVFLYNGDYVLTLEATNSVPDLNILNCTVSGPDPTYLHFDGYNKPLGGLRIKQIVASEQNSHLTTNYTYTQEGDATKSSGSLVETPEYAYTVTSVSAINAYPSVVQTSKSLARTSSSKISLGLTHGAYVGYEFVQVTKQDDLNTTQNGQTTFKYTTAKNYPNAGQTTFPFPGRSNFDEKRGLLLEQKEFAYKNNVFSIIKHTINDYTIPDTRYAKESSGIVLGSDEIDKGSSGLITAPAHVVYGTTVDKSIWVWLSNQTVRNYASDLSGNFMQTQVTYHYDNLNHLLPTQIDRSTSRGTLSTYYKYPSDFSNIDEDQVSMDMKGTKNMLNSPIQITTVRNEGASQKIVNSTILKYAYTGSIILPSQHLNFESASSVDYTNASQFPVYKPVSDISGSPLFKIKANYSYNALGNLLTQQKLNDMPVSYIWDYASLYPIAEVKNALSTQIAYTSFESDGTGGWSVPSTLRDKGAAITGRMSYNLTNGNITRTGLEAGVGYILSYWSKSGTYYTMSGSGSFSNKKTQGKTINGWTYFEHRIQATSTTDVSISGADDIDELRLFPVTAQMTTYSHDPLIGITAQCDMNNRITYYSYDGFGRLTTIRDQDLNVLKRTCYNYYGQVAACAEISSPSICTGTGKRSVNGVCETGQIVYTSSIFTGEGYSCTYHYLWSDGSVSQNYTQSSSSSCNVNGNNQ